MRFTRLIRLLPLILVFLTGCATVDLPVLSSQTQANEPVDILPTDAAAYEENTVLEITEPLPTPLSDPHEDGAEPLQEVLARRPDLAELDQIFRRALGLLADGRIVPATDRLFVLKDQIYAFSPAEDDTIASAYLTSLDRRVALLSGVVAEEQALSINVIPGDDVLSDAYADMRGLAFPDSLIPISGEQRRAIESDLLSIDNKLVNKWMDHFLGDGRRHFSRWLSRMSAIDSLIYSELDQAGLPRELIYLAAVESGFNANARSYVGAVGPWQFMPATARHFKLRTDWWVDERRDIQLSTRAAAKYLSQLYNQFGDWSLVLAAYNTGENRVARSIKRAGHDNFWDLRLPTQTRNHIPKIIAAARIGADPEAYGLDVEERADLSFETVEVTDATDLDLIARCAGVEADGLKTLNPGLIRSATPPGKSDYTVKVPLGTAKLCMQKLRKIPLSERLTWRRHVVERGQTLGRIAQSYGTTVRDITRLNKLSNAALIHPGDKLLIPMPATLSQHIQKRAEEKGHYVPPAGYERVSYKVKSGDTLGGVARKLGVSLKHIRSVNNIHKTNLIRPGQRLYAYRPGS
jgi:peptidoglycan lytic transglycosylase D